MAESWCGYIDMLSTRAIAQRSPQELNTTLSNFHAALEAAFEHFETGECWAFSDGAFFRCESETDFFDFYRRVRNDLFQQQIFFRCSFLRGEIDVVERPEVVQKKALASGRTRRFFSMTFTKDAAVAYKRESEFKGIGCTIDPGMSHAGAKSNLATTYFIAQQNGSVRAVKSVDVTFGAQELGRTVSGESPPVGERRLFDAIVDACQVSLSLSERVGAYYCTPLVTAIRSLDLRRVDFNEGRWIDAPYVFEELIAGPVPKQLRHMPGLHFVLLSCFDRLYAQRGTVPPAVERQVLLQMAKFPQCFRRLDEVPDYVISHEARSRLVKLHVEMEKELERTRRAEAVERLKRKKDATQKAKVQSEQKSRVVPVRDT